MVQANKKIALLHRHPAHMIKETNAAFRYLVEKGIEIKTFKKFNRLNKRENFWKSILWIFYAPLLVIGRGYDVIYCDDSYPFYPALVKLVSQKSKVIIRLGDFHLMYHFSGRMYKFLHKIEVWCWQKVDMILPISEAMYHYLICEIPTFVPMKVVLDPVDQKDFCLRKVYTNKTVMFHGTITKNKNIDLLIEAAYEMPDISFDIIGDGPDLKRLMKKATGMENVYFHGWVPFKEIYDLLRMCGVGVALRSNNPGNEYVVTSPFLQYGIMGKPCLVTKRKVFGDYHWQFSNIDEMVAKLRYLLDHSVEEGEKLQKYILENHEAKKIGEEIWSLLQS